MVLLRQLSDAIRTQLKAFLAFCCVFITEGWLLRTERIYYGWGHYNADTSDFYSHKDTAQRNSRGFECLELLLYDIRELA